MTTGIMVKELLVTLPDDVLLLCLGPKLDLPSVVGLSQACRRLRALTSDEDDWRCRTYAHRYTRSVVHQEQSWRALCAGLVFHASQCAACLPHFQAVYSFYYYQGP